MADLGQWWKLWVSAIDDPDLDNLDVADFGRWAKFGALVKAQGTAGKITVRSPARQLCAMFQLPDFGAVSCALERFPHADVRREKDDVTGETIITFQFHNWPKYQGDFSTPRVRRFREMKRSKRRGEERREEETRKDPPVVPLSSQGSTTGPIETQVEEAVRKYQPLEAYRLIDVRQAALNCQNWCVTRKKAFTDRRLVNWLNSDAMKAASAISRTKSQPQSPRYGDGAYNIPMSGDAGDSPEERARIERLANPLLARKRP